MVWPHCGGGGGVEWLFFLRRCKKRHKAYRIFAEHIVHIKLRRFVGFWGAFTLAFTADDSHGDQADKNDRADADGGDDGRLVEVDDGTLQIDLVVVVNRLKFKLI